MEMELICTCPASRASQHVLYQMQLGWCQYLLLCMRFKPVCSMASINQGAGMSFGTQIVTCCTATLRYPASCQPSDEILFDPLLCE